jgi:hypothetical protein
MDFRFEDVLDFLQTVMALENVDEMSSSEMCLAAKNSSLLTKRLKCFAKFSASCNSTLR